MARDSYKPAVPLGDVIQSISVGQVIGSHHSDFKPGDIVRGDFGWQDYAVTDGKGFGSMQKVPVGTRSNLALSLIEGEERACAGMMKVCGPDHNRVRLAVIAGAVNLDEIQSDAPLYESFDEMARANGYHPAPSKTETREELATRLIAGAKAELEAELPFKAVNGKNWVYARDSEDEQ
jgi:hypothetical protein